MGKQTAFVIRIRQGLTLYAAARMENRKCPANLPPSRALAWYFSDNGLHDEISMPRMSPSREHHPVHPQMPQLRQFLPRLADRRLGNLRCDQTPAHQVQPIDHRTGAGQRAGGADFPIEQWVSVDAQSVVHPRRHQLVLLPQRAQRESRIQRAQGQCGVSVVLRIGRALKGHSVWLLCLRSTCPDS